LVFAWVGLFAQGRSETRKGKNKKILARGLVGSTAERNLHGTMGEGGQLTLTSSTVARLIITKYIVILSYFTETMRNNTSSCAIPCTVSKNITIGRKWTPCLQRTLQSHLCQTTDALYTACTLRCGSDDNQFQFASYYNFLIIYTIRPGLHYAARYKSRRQGISFTFWSLCYSITLSLYKLSGHASTRLKLLGVALLARANVLSEHSRVFRI